MADVVRGAGADDEERVGVGRAECVVDDTGAWVEVRARVGVGVALGVGVASRAPQIDAYSPLGSLAGGGGWACPSS